MIIRRNKAGWIFFLLWCTLSFTVSGQDWKSVVGGVANAIAGEKNLSLKGLSLEGTWNYTAPDCKFTSDNLLAKAGGEVAAKKIEDKMSEILVKLGFTEGCTYVFNADSTYSSTVKGRTTHGSYSYDAETKELHLKAKRGMKFTAIVSRNMLNNNKISLLFKVDKMMSLIQTVGGILGDKSSNSAVEKANALLKEYDGLQLGFELERQK